MSDSDDLPTVLITREHAFRAAQNAVRNQGYAVALHGSQVKDLDLVAVPWQETAIDAESCAALIAAAIPGDIAGQTEEKPYGRLGFTIFPRYHWGFDRWYIDLSVMPRALDPKPGGRKPAHPPNPETRAPVTSSSGSTPEGQGRCRASYEAVMEQEELGDTGCPLCGRRAEAHPHEMRTDAEYDESDGHA